MKKISNGIYFINSENTDGYSNQSHKAFLDVFPMMALKDKGIGFAEVYGPLGHGYWDSMFSDYQSLQANLEMLEHDEDVKHIVLIINSPGGAVSGLFTACDYIKGLHTPITAFVTGEACSAAFAIASSCDKVYIERDAVTGCCGCYAEAYEAKEENFLKKVFRSAISPKKNLSVVTNEQAQKEYQARIDKLGTEYLDYVATNRGVDYETALTSFGEGLVVDAQYALEAQMVDGIATFDDVIENISSQSEANEDEGEGEIEDMTKEDIAKMTSEQRAELFGTLCSADPSLLSSTREGERARILALNKLRDPLNDAVNALVEGAISDGRTASDIALDVLEAVRIGHQEEQNDRQNALNAMAQGTQIVNTPPEFDEEAFITEAVKEIR